jgi:hypothetical protein
MAARATGELTHLHELRCRRDAPFLAFNAYAARSFSPDAAAPEPGNVVATRAGVDYQSPQWQFQAGYGGIGERFHDEMGFVPRQGIHNFDGRFGPRLRPRALSNLRFNLIHCPLSDFFLVYNERRDDRTGDLVSRAVIAKMTYMMVF